MRLLIGVMATLFLVVFVWVLQYAAPPNQGFPDAAAAIAVISGSAVAIERLIELGWTIIGQWRDSWWPLSELGQQADRVEAKTNAMMEPAIAAGMAELAKLKAAAKKGSADVAKFEGVEQKVADIRAEFDRRVAAISTIARGTERLNMYVALTKSTTDRLQIALGSVNAATQAVERAAQVAIDAADFATALTGTFRDNPARRIISIYLGMIGGMIVAGFLGLDIFRAAGQAAAGSAVHYNVLVDFGVAKLLAADRWFPFLGVAMTGIVIGLGSNPTHEVIKLVSESKKQGKANNEAQARNAAALAS